MDAGWQLIAEGLASPEGPAFAEDGSLWPVELKGGALVRLPTEGFERAAVEGGPNGLAFWRDEVRCCDADGMDAYVVGDVGGAETLVLTSPGELNRANDVAFDALGKLVRAGSRRAGRKHLVPILPNFSGDARCAESYSRPKSTIDRDREPFLHSISGRPPDIHWGGRQFLKRDFAGLCPSATLKCWKNKELRYD